MGRVTGPVGGSKSGRRTKVGKQLGRGDAALGGTSIRVMRQRQINPDGSIDRIKTISIHPPLLGSASFQRKYPGVANAMPPFRFTRIKEGIVAEIGEETFDHTLPMAPISILTPDYPITVVEGAEVVEESYFREYTFNASVYGPDWEPNPQVASYKSGSSECWPRNFGYTGSIMRNQAGLFSGTMKKVVQLSAGLNIPIPYSFCWAKTHGIWVGLDGSHWLISISAEGIYAAPMVQERELTIEENEDFGTLIGYIPAFDPQLNENVGDWYMLATAGEVADAYDKSPMYETCGWAFSEDGSEAGNTCWQYERNPNDPIHSCKHGYRYKIEIRGETEPISALMSEESDGWLWTEEQPFKVPIAIVLYEVPIYALISFWLSSTGLCCGQAARPLADDQDIKADLHVWYDGNDEMVLQFTHTGTTEEVGYTDPCLPSKHTPKLSHFDKDWYREANITTGGSVLLEVVGGDSDINYDEEFVSDTFAEKIIFSEVVEYGMHFAVFGGSGGTTHVADHMYHWDMDTYISGASWKYYQPIAIVPLFCREGIYIGQRQQGKIIAGGRWEVDRYALLWGEGAPRVTYNTWFRDCAGENPETRATGRWTYSSGTTTFCGGPPETPLHPVPDNWVYQLRYASEGAACPAPSENVEFAIGPHSYYPISDLGGVYTPDVTELSSAAEMYFCKGNTKIELVSEESSDSYDAHNDAGEWFRIACIVANDWCGGPQHLVAHFDAFSVVEEEDNSGFFSNAPGGLHYVEDEDNPGYSVVPGYYIHNIDNEKYPIEGLSESNQWRGWFGVPKPEDET